MHSANNVALSLKINNQEPTHTTYDIMHLNTGNGGVTLRVNDQSSLKKNELAENSNNNHNETRPTIDVISDQNHMENEMMMPNVNTMIIPNQHSMTHLDE